MTPSSQIDKFLPQKDTPHKTNGRRMKRFFVLFVLMSTLLTPLLGHDEKKLGRWESTYSLVKMDEKTLASLAIGMRSLMLKNPTDSNSVSSVLYTFQSKWKEAGLPADCYNALVKACEQAVLCYSEKYTEDKNQIWQKTLFEYYKKIVELLETKLSKKEKIEAKPTLLKKLPQVDSVYHNLRRPNDFQMGHRSKQPVGSLKIVWVTRSL